MSLNLPAIESSADRQRRSHSELAIQRPSMRNTIGFLMQFAALILLPMLIVWQLDFGMKLLWMPMLTIVGICLFWLGTTLRDKTE